MSYQGIFLRHYLGQQPGSTGGPWSASPDVVPTGATPISDPERLVVDYNTDLGSPVLPGQINFVYVRGLNTGSAPATARFWLFYTPSNLMLWPQTWRSDGITVNGQPQNFVEVTIAPGQVGAGPAFVWQAPPLPAGNTYCLIAYAENAPLSQPPQAPLPASPLPSTDALAQYVSGNPALAWRDTVEVSAAVPTWQQVIPVTGPPEGGSLMLGIQCQNMPTDGYVAFSVPGPDAASTVHMPKTQISYPSMAITFPVTWPPNFATEATITYWMGATPPPAGASISPQVLVPVSGDRYLAIGGTTLRFR